MITIGFCTRAHSREYIDHLIQSCGLPKSKVEIIERINNGESLTVCYNEILSKASHDIVVLCHDDIIINTKNWGDKLISHFKKNEEFGILGVAGSKYMPESGKWWEKRQKMYGRVTHSNDGKTWLSAYSNDLGNKIEEVVNVDGLFIALHKNRIKSQFDETVKGFHFYDVDFSFTNHIQGVKVGVITNIKITHKSVGMTNDEWEDNRVIFAEKHKEILPINIKETFANRKLKVLIGCLNFNSYTGSELYVFELAKSLIKDGCDVSICSSVGGEIAKQAARLGIKLYSLNEPPTFKRGDGKWAIKNEDGTLTPSVENTLYKLNDETFDVLHLNHKPVTEHLLKLYPDTPVVCSIHSEIISLEHPVKHPNIKKYIAIRPDIKDFMINDFEIDPEMIDVVYNPIDSNRFKPVSVKNKTKKVLFVGTIDYLRKNAILDLIESTREEGSELTIVGKENGVEIKTLIANHTHVTYHPATPNIEQYVKACDETAGILMGRTTIEGWLCGKKGWIYDVNEVGDIISKKLMDVPNDVDKFKAENVGKIIKEIYKDIVL